MGGGNKREYEAEGQGTRLRVVAVVFKMAWRQYRSAGANHRVVARRMPEAEASCCGVNWRGQRGWGGCFCCWVVVGRAMPSAVG